MLDIANTVDEDSGCEEAQSYTLKELKDVNSRAFEKVLDRMRQQEMQYGWWQTVIEGWAERLPSEFGIHLSGSKNPEIYFSMHTQGEGVSFGRAWIDATFYAEKSAMAQGDILLKTAMEQGWVDGLTINSNTRYNFISGISVEWMGPEYVNVEGTVFDGADTEELYCRLQDMEDDLAKEAQSYVEEVCDSIMEDLEAESDYLTSEEYLLERADEMDMTFDEDGNEL